MAVINAVIWGLIQGVTEFIPISSSGHLVVIPRLFGIESPGLIFTVALHAGTLAAVIIFFWKDIIALFVSQKRLGIEILIASVPIFVFGLVFVDYIKPLFEHPKVVGWMFIINGGIILIGHVRLRRVNPSHFREMNAWRAFAVGIAQSFALLPGISRSGITITAGVYAGLDRKDAFKFSFLLFIPAALLALLYSIKEASSAHYIFDLNLIVGAAFSAIFGLVALKLLFTLITKAKLHILSIYCLILGLVTLYVFK
jgi:undecaprenyl-diphosphatase